MLVAENERVVEGFLGRTQGAQDLTPTVTASWPPRPGQRGLGYQVLPGESGELAKEVERVRLVPGALPSEHVCIKDGDLHASSLQSSTTDSAARSQVS